MIITKKDLYANQYDYETLKTNIYCVSLIDILNTQFLTAEFCIKYILNNKFQLTDEDQNITIELVKCMQPHLTEDDFIKAELSVSIKRLNRERIDSFEDFESYASRYE
jgi:hypothetical protein